jgi:hypothetical protein
MSKVSSNYVTQSKDHLTLFYWFLAEKLDPMGKHRQWFFLARAVQDGCHTLEYITEYILDLQVNRRLGIFNIQPGDQSFIGNLIAPQLSALKKRQILIADNGEWCFTKTSTYWSVEEILNTVDFENSDETYAMMIFFIRLGILGDDVLGGGCKAANRELSSPLKFEDGEEFQTFIQNRDHHIQEQEMTINDQVTAIIEILNVRGRLTGRQLCDALKSIKKITPAQLRDLIVKDSDSVINTEQNNDGEWEYWVNGKSVTAGRRTPEDNVRFAEMVIALLTANGRMSAKDIVHTLQLNASSDEEYRVIPTGAQALGAILRNDPRFKKTKEDHISFYELTAANEVIRSVTFEAGSEAHEERFNAVAKFVRKLADGNYVSKDTKPRIDIVYTELGFALYVNVVRAEIKGRKLGVTIKSIDPFLPVMILTLAPNREYLEDDNSKFVEADALCISGDGVFHDVPDGIRVFLAVATT